MLLFTALIVKNIPTRTSKIRSPNPRRTMSPAEAYLRRIKSPLTERDVINALRIKQAELSGSDPQTNPYETAYKKFLRTKRQNIRQGKESPDRKHLIHLSAREFLLAVRAEAIKRGIDKPLLGEKLYLKKERPLKHPKKPESSKKQRPKKQPNLDFFRQ